MGIPSSQVGYTLATTRRADHEVHKGYVMELAQKTSTAAHNPRAEHQLINNHCESLKSYTKYDSIDFVFIP
jgi:hypothetical protein